MSDTPRAHIYECFRNDMEDLDKQLANGQITRKAYQNYKDNLEHNLAVDLAELEED